MTNRALLVGINSYAEQPLRGCVHDVLDMATLLTERYQFARQDVTLLIDGRATRAAILSRLRALVQSLQPGDRALFHFSGHGVQLLSSSSEEADGLDEAICPVDYSWNDLSSFLRDKDFRRELASVPDGVSFVWVSDSCHSGTLSRALTRGHDSRPRTLQLPADLEWQVESARRRPAVGPRGLSDAARELPLALLAACQPEQTAADAVFDGRANGALTYFLVKELTESTQPEQAMLALTRRVAQRLVAAQQSARNARQQHARDGHRRRRDHRSQHHRPVQRSGVRQPEQHGPFPG
ncbi:MAG: caspase family protein [Myxococcales bacterium]|nr:caspase family protein [Myxococcales bacterium]